MHLVNSAPDCIELRGRDAVRSPVWVGLGLLLGPTVLSLVGPAPFTALHVAGTITLLALSTGLIALGWPRRRWVRIRLAQDPERDGRRGTIATSEDDGERPLGADLTARLIAVPTEGSSGNALYGVGLELPTSDTDGAAARPLVLLIARADPSDTLSDLASLKMRLPLRVVGGWGLPTSSPWTDAPAPVSRGSGRTAPWDDRAARRPVALALVVGGVAIGCAMMMEIKGRLNLGDSPAAVSIVLPLFGLTLLGLVTVALVTHGVRIVLGQELSCERRIFGVSYAEQRVGRADVRGVYPVSPSGHHARHVLFDTAARVVAFPCDDVLATKVAAEFRR
jgi:hypothetical protein